MPETGPIDLEPETPHRRTIRPLPEATMFVPPLVKLVAVEDTRRLPPDCGDALLDRFYVEFLGFAKGVPVGGRPVYRAEKFCLTFDLPYEAVADDEVLPPVGIRVPRELDKLEKALLDDWRIEPQRLTTLWPGGDALLFEAPGGTLLALGEYREVL